MAGIAAALAVGREEDACRQFCAEVLSASRHWGPAEQRAVFDRLPLLLQRFYAWLGLPAVGIEEALLRTFHPKGPLVAHLATWGAPAFVFPLRRLPPRALRAAVLSITDGGRATSQGRAGALGQRGQNDFGSAWFGLLGPGRVAKTPAGEVDGVAMTALEFTLTCFVHYLVSEQPAASATGRGSGGGGAAFGGGLGQPSGGAGDPGGAGALGGAGFGSSGAGGAGTSGGFEGFGGAGGAGGSSLGGMGGSSSRSSRMLGSLSPAFERLFLAHLQAHLQHSEYELAYGHEPRSARFLLHLLNEFLLAPQPCADALPTGVRHGSVLGQDVRARPASLHAARLVAVHILANPALRRGCEETLGVGLTASGSRAARLTREVALLGPPLVDLVSELLASYATQKQTGLETLTSLMRLWLVLLQPWKAKRIHAWYLTVRPSEPRLEPPPPVNPAASAVTRLTRQTDVALLGLEPEMSSSSREAPSPPLVPGGAGASPALPASAAGAPLALPLLPGEGDAQSWRGYVAKFHSAYALFEAFLTTPLHTELCLPLCFSVGGSGAQEALRSASQPPGAPAGAGAPAAAAAPGSASAAVVAWGASGSPSAQHLLRQRHAVAALKALAQALLCFTEPQLLAALAALPAEADARGSLAAPLFAEGRLRPQVVLAVSVAWSALLAAASNHELQPLLSAISRQLQHTPQWVPHRLPPLESTQLHQAYALETLRELGRRLPAAVPSEVAPAAGIAGASPLSKAAFVGSEWQRPLRGGEVELLLQVAYWLAGMIDQMVGREPKRAACGQVPQTEWPRMFANWKLLCVLLVTFLLPIVW